MGGTAVCARFAGHVWRIFKISGKGPWSCWTLCLMRVNQGQCLANRGPAKSMIFAGYFRVKCLTRNQNVWQRTDGSLDILSGEAGWTLSFHPLLINGGITLFQKWTNHTKMLSTFGDVLRTSKLKQIKVSTCITGSQGRCHQLRASNKVCYSFIISATFCCREWNNWIRGIGGPAWCDCSNSPIWWWGLNMWDCLGYAGKTAHGCQSLCLWGT